MLLGEGASSAAYRSVAVQLHDGSTMTIGMESDLTATITSGEVVFSCSQGDVAIPAEKVHYWSFTTREADPGIWSGVEEATIATIKITQSNNSLNLSGLVDGTAVTLSSVSGLVAAVAVANRSGSCSLDISGLCPGVYILSYGNNSVKFIMPGR